MFNRLKFVAKSLFTREGRSFLSAMSGGKALTHSVLTELVAGSSWFQGLPLSKLGDFDSYLRAASRKVWVLWKCADLKANVAMDTPWSVVSKASQGRKTEWVDSEFIEMTTTPNPWQTFEDMIYQTSIQLSITGNCFWAKDVRNLMGERPGQLRILNPKRMSIIVDVRSGVIGYVYRPIYAQDRADFSRPIPFKPEEIIHFRVPHPDNDFWGLGEVEAGEPLFNSFVNFDTWEQSYWARGATPTTLLILKGQFPGGAQKFAEMKAQWEKDYGGTENAGKTGWLTGDWSREQMGLSLDEMQAIEQRRWTVEQIALQCGVPLSVLGLEAAANYATARTADVQFRRYTVKPQLKRIASRITRDLLPEWGDGLEFRFNLGGLVNVEEIAASYVPLIDRGIVTPNEVRGMIELEPSDEPMLDSHYMSPGLVPIELAGMSNMPEVEEEAEKAVRRFIEVGRSARPNNGHKGVQIRMGSNGMKPVAE